MNNNNTPKPHPHAELIKAWADGAKIQYWNESRHEWVDKGDPCWYEWCEYRVKPEEPWKPKEDETFYVVNEMGYAEDRMWMNGRASLNDCYAIGNCFRTREEAKAAAERVKAALKGELVDKEEYERVCTQNKALRHDLKEYQKGLEIIATNGLSELKKTAPSDENFQLDGKQLSDGEKALIRALRAVRIMEVYPWDNSVVVYKYGNGELMHTSQVIAFSLYAPSSSIKKAMDEINTALACIADERYKGGIQ